MKSFSGDQPLYSASSSCTYKFSKSSSCQNIGFGAAKELFGIFENEIKDLLNIKVSKKILENCKGKYVKSLEEWEEDLEDELEEEYGLI